MTCAKPTVHIPIGSNTVVTFDMAPRLESTELLTGTPTVADEGATGDLTIANAQVNSVADVGNDIEIGKAVQFQVSTSVTECSEYTIAITAVTDGTPSQTLYDEMVIVFHD